ncbi:cbb3-type cytochrome oxidase subunit 3 [Thiohalomonas denitrificans]|uniref:Cytochrome c oxidase cbb3-type subunit 4 n=1 Tax=Thiohalomonas denitrificans TaxID=415747 RepID=A0A1G5QGQ8_9GAMM|nr:cbb3-type cytochrome c oxidase subunit 3 [Thiohalomonas denitrificans]SCZ60917.1 cytochrome c oxidase cbb3-type subunit 4 [Thiohalomonas denitrificans]
MSKFEEYFHTDWASLTVHDWIGLIITVIVFLLMVGLYVWVFHPKNKEKFESQRHIPLENDFDSEDKK